MVDAYYDDAGAAEPVVHDYYDEYDALLKGDGAAAEEVIYTNNDVDDGSYYIASNDDDDTIAGLGTEARAMVEEKVQAIKDEIDETAQRVVERVDEAATASSSAADPVPGESTITTSQMEISKHDTGIVIAKRLATAALNPYVLILVAYLGGVAAELVCVTRSALDHKVRKHLKQRSVQGYAILAGLNLASTWTFLIKYLFDSHATFLKNTRIVGQELTSVPSCVFDRSARCMAARATAQLMRIGTWLEKTTLFEEAWLMVVVGQLNWWWSAEVCTFTVGFWALYVRIQGARYNVPHLWAYMLLGQTCAISVAASIFSMAIEARKDVAQLRGDVSVLSGVAFEGSSSSSKRRGSDASMPPPVSPRRRSGKAADAILQPSLRSKLLMLAAVLAGSACVYFKPTDLNLILAMHAAPMLIATPIFDELVPRTSSISGFESFLSTTVIYAITALVSLVIRLRLHYDVFHHGFDLNDLKNVFFSTSAQASISSDVVGITLYAVTALVLQIAAASRAGQSKGLIAVYVFLILTTPVLGPSATMATVFAIEEHRIHKASAGRTTKAPAGRTSTSSVRSSLSNSITTPMKERITEIFSRRPSSSSSPSTTGSTRKKASSSTSVRRKASTSSINESANESAAESTAPAKKPAPRRKAKQETEESATTVKKPRGRPKKAAADASAAEASATEGDESSASTTKTRKRATATRGRSASTATKNAATTRTRKTAAKAEAEDEDDATSAASGTDVDGPATRTRRTASTTRGRGRGGRRKATA